MMYGAALICRWEEPDLHLQAQVVWLSDWHMYSIKSCRKDW